MLKSFMKRRFGRQIFMRGCRTADEGSIVGFIAFRQQWSINSETSLVHGKAYLSPMGK